MVVRNHLALLRNLRNITEAGVSSDHIKRIRKAFAHPSWVNAKTLPVNFIAAAKAAPMFEREIETAMLASLSGIPKLPGRTVLVVDVSGSMGAAISGKSDLSRLDAAAGMAMLAAEQCESVAIYATAGSDGRHTHKTAALKPRRGFALAEEIQSAARTLGGGGIFTRQALEYIKGVEREMPDRIMVFSDSQDCDRDATKVPSPFGKRNYIIDVGGHTRGINYSKVWTAEIIGWSEHFFTYVAASEGASVAGEEQD